MRLTFKRVYVIDYTKGLTISTTYAKGFLQKIKTIKQLKKQGYFIKSVDKF